ncbi:MAG TPA: phosphoribosylanthranilate isomerase [Pirellulales bacterium]|nr:phosphoribosylanthranilate isomerase [Pirellulales bacterium]
MFRIKICGITTAADALCAARAGADAIGLNFCAASKRRVDLERAQEIIAALPGHVVKVGVFADADAEQVAEIARRLSFDALQLHGHETPADLAALRDYRLIKAFGCGPHGHLAVIDFVAQCERLGFRPAMVLLDAASAAGVGSPTGGTGRLADWVAATSYRDQPAMPPLVLAGGLTAENVGQAIRHVRPAAVDTASGVELSPGFKDHEKVGRFIAAAQKAMQNDARDNAEL